MVHKAIGASSKYGWWNNSWRLLKDLHITPENVGNANLADLKDDLLGSYRRWWLQQFTDPNAHPKLCTFRLFKESFAPSTYLIEGPSYFRPAALRFRCSSHRLDIELGRHTGIPRSDRKCRFVPLQLWVMNITPSNVQHSWIYRSSVTSMFHPNRSSSL